MRPGKNIRLFKSSFLERFSYVHPILPIGIWGPLVTYWFASGLIHHAVDVSTSLALAGGGLFTWTLSEYLLHRFVFHFKPNGPIQERISFMLHGIHHEDPADERRLLMPPVAGGVIALFFYTIFVIVLGGVLVKPFFAGFILGYLCYDYTHWAVHFLPLKSRFFKGLKQNHMTHHFVTPHERFGVSGMLWDHVFGTHGAKTALMNRSDRTRPGLNH